MAFHISEAMMNLWDSWHIRIFMIISLSLQIFLNVVAPERKKSKVVRKWFFRWPFWLAYMFADWVATSTIGLILGQQTFPSNGPPSDLLMFWAPFLLLHLGGPDNITSYSLEDNELWKRHLFQLVLQVGFTIYIVFKFFSNNRLLVPAMLVLFAGIVKYAERNIAFYRASIDHLGVGWANDLETQSKLGLPVPKQFEDVRKWEEGNDSSVLKAAVELFGILKRLLVGPLIDNEEETRIEEAFSKIRKQHGDVLRVMEIELSLLYEVLHTKLPVIASKTGFQFRLANLGCIFLALLSFTFALRHYQLAVFDIWLTYVLLIGAIVLDIASMLLLIKRSDWFAVCRFKGASDAIHKRRWSNMVSQSNLVTYYVKEYPIWLKQVASFPYVGILFQAIKVSRCESYKSFGKVNGLWSFIVTEVEGFRDHDPQIQELWLTQKGKDLLTRKEQKCLNGLDYTQSLLVLHIASELCFQVDNSNVEANGNKDYKAICKLLSNYMFNLAVTRSQMMSTVLDNWESEFEDLLEEISEINVKSSCISLDERNICRKLIDHEFIKVKKFPRLPPGVGLANELRKRRSSNDQWEVMSQIWVQFMGYAAINCRADVHARQLSQGGELLTFVWLLMNHLGLGIRSYTTLDLGEDDVEEEEEEKSSPVVKNLYTNNSSFNVQSQYHVNMFPWSMY